LPPGAFAPVNHPHHGAGLGVGGVRHVGAVDPGVAGENPLHAALQNGNSNRSHPVNLSQGYGVRSLLSEVRGPLSLVLRSESLFLDPVVCGPGVRNEQSE